jgi:cysteine desulfuration protein SufE
MTQSLNFLTQSDDWSEKYQAIMDFGRELPELDAKYKTNENKIAGCQSRVWVNLELIDDLVHIKGEADSRLVQGLLAIIIETYKNKTPSGILEQNEDWIGELGLDKNISMIRRSGMNAIIKFIKDRVPALGVIKCQSL